MNLHKNEQEYKETILYLSNKLNVSPAIIEKDYFVTLFLKTLAQRVPDILFKGGTSLSKCYKIINRFSEDIDLTLQAEKQTTGMRRKLKYEIISVCEDLGLELLNVESIRSRRDYNKYEIKYPIHFNGIGIKQYLLVETVFMLTAYPDEVKIASSMIYDFWKEEGYNQEIVEYELEPFDIRVQCLERTLIDKVFALCDYYISNNLEGHSRHIYDLYKLFDLIKFDDNFKKLISDVRQDRKTNSRCYSAQDQYDIQDILKQIIEKEIYYPDYKKITEKVLFDNTSYETAITVLEKIIKSGFFESK